MGLGAYTESVFYGFNRILGIELRIVPLLCCVLGLLMSFSNIAGCTAVRKNNQKMALAYAVIVGILFLTELSLGIVVLVMFPVQVDTTVRTNAENALEDYHEFTQARFAWGYIQRKFDCCGLDDYSDWFAVQKNALPDECSFGTYKPCWPSLKRFIEDKCQMVGITLVVLCCLYIPTIGFLYLVMKLKTKEDEEQLKQVEEGGEDAEEEDVEEEEGDDATTDVDIESNSPIKNKKRVKFKRLTEKITERKNKSNKRSDEYPELSSLSDLSVPSEVFTMLSKFNKDLKQVK